MSADLDPTGLGYDLHEDDDLDPEEWEKYERRKLERCGVAAGARHRDGRGRSSHTHRKTDHMTDKDLPDELRYVLHSAEPAEFARIVTEAADEIDKLRAALAVKDNHDHFDCTAEIQMSADLPDRLGELAFGMEQTMPTIAKLVAEAADEIDRVRANERDAVKKWMAAEVRIKELETRLNDAVARSREARG